MNRKLMLATIFSTMPCSCRDMRIENIPGEGLAAGDKVFGRLG